MARVPVLLAGATAQMTPFPSSARPSHSSKSSLVLFLSPSMPSKADESQQSRKRSNGSSQAHQTFIMLPSSCNSCCWLYQEPELNRANSRSHTQAAVSAPSSMDVPVGADEAVPAPPPCSEGPTGACCRARRMAWWVRGP